MQKFWQYILLLLLITLLYPQFAKLTVPDSTEVDWKIELCVSGKNYNISKVTSESVGVWFVEPLTIEKACFNSGVWAIYKEWCQVNPTIWAVGKPRKFSCMKKKLLEKVLGLIYLGKEDGGVIVSISKQKLFFGSLKLTTQSWDLIDPELNVISWGHHKVPYVLVQEKDDLPVLRTCVVPTTPFFNQFKINATYTSKVVLYLYQDNNCTNILKSPSMLAKVLPLPQILSDLRVSYGSTTSKRENETLCCQGIKSSMKTCESDKPLLFGTYIAKIVDEQSARLALQFQRHIFNKLPLPDINLRQWKLIEISKKIFNSVCPHQLVPKFFFDNIIVLLKYLLLESVTKTPRINPMGDSTLSRIEAILQRCCASAKEFMFIPKDSCSNNIFIQIKYSNGSVLSAPVNLPDELRNNVSIYDLIVEGTWKLILFTYYTCASHFHQHGSDFSVFYEMWQELVTEDLQNRWTNPGKSYEMMKLIFKSINLGRTVKNLDYCVATAQMQSISKGWMKRPFQVKDNRTKIVTKDVIFDGIAYSIDSYTYPALRLGYSIENCGVKFCYQE